MTVDIVVYGADVKNGTAPPLGVPAASSCSRECSTTDSGGRLRSAHGEQSRRDSRATTGEDSATDKASVVGAPAAPPLGSIATVSVPTAFHTTTKPLGEPASADDAAPVVDHVTALCASARKYVVPESSLHNSASGCTESANPSRLTPDAAPVRSCSMPVSWPAGVKPCA